MRYKAKKYQTKESKKYLIIKNKDYAKVDALNIYKIESQGTELPFAPMNEHRFDPAPANVNVEYVDFVQCRHLVSPQDYSVDLDRQLTAIDNLNHIMYEKLIELISDCATDLQLKIFTKSFYSGKTLERIAEEMDLLYFSVHSSLYGQRSNNKFLYAKGKKTYKPNPSRGMMVGGLFPKIKKKVKKNSELQRLYADLNLIHAGDEDTIEEYTKDYHYDQNPNQESSSNT